MLVLQSLQIKPESDLSCMILPGHISKLEGVRRCLYSRYSMITQPTVINRLSKEICASLLLLTKLANTMLKPKSCLNIVTAGSNIEILETNSKLDIIVAMSIFYIKSIFDFNYIS